MTKAQETIRIGCLDMPIAWCEERDDVLFTRYNREKNRIEPFIIPRKGFMKALNEVAERVPDSPGLRLMRVALTEMNNQQLGELIERMSINNAQQFALNDAEKGVVDSWFASVTGDMPEEGPSTIGLHRESTRRGFLRGGARFMLGFATFISGFEALTGIPRGDEPEKIQQQALISAGSAAMLAGSEVGFHHMNREERTAFYAAQTVKFLNSKAREFLLAQHPDIVQEQSRGR